MKEVNAELEIVEMIAVVPRVCYCIVQKYTEHIITHRDLRPKIKKVV